jgi:TldD protein
MLLWLCATVSLAGDLRPLLADELDRALAALADRTERPHYAAIAIEDRYEGHLSARNGTIFSESDDVARYLDVDLRVGEPALDSTHELRGFSAMEGDDRAAVAIPVDDEAAVRHAVWRTLDARYREHAERIVLVRANQRVKVEEERVAPDFGPGAPAGADGPVAPADASLAPEWAAILSDLSAILDDHPDVQSSGATLDREHVVKTFVDSEDRALRHQWTHTRLSMSVSTTAADGDVVSQFDAIDVHDPASLPDADALRAKARALVDRLIALRDAPRGEPFSGPVLLAGKATGVFFHEVLGHRVEGHRQKREDEGQTFADLVGQRVLPTWVDVYDDPTVARRAGEDLNGHYVYDDEGSPASRADIVRDGLFAGFLMGRSPIPGFEQTNGHSRRAAGNPPVPRMGNTIVDVEGGVPLAQLKDRLRALAREQGLPFGVLVEEIDGGFTLTGRTMPNAFNVRASTSYRVYVDGRPDELVRGIDLVGTPLVAFDNVVAAGDTPEVFNGFCGAESGWVPVSAVAPPLLFRRLEFQLKEKAQDRPPLLPKPRTTDGAADAGEVR